jgi:hypothetical protein
MKKNIRSHYPSYEVIGLCNAPSTATTQSTLSLHGSSSSHLITYIIKALVLFVCPIVNAFRSGLHDVLVAPATRIFSIRQAAKNEQYDRRDSSKFRTEFYLGIKGSLTMVRCKNDDHAHAELCTKVMSAALHPPGGDLTGGDSETALIYSQITGKTMC